MIKPEVVDQVRQATEIVELIGEYLPLKRVGASYRALCPFHPERTPSFYVHPERQIYHCFGCGAGGNAITFLMRYEHLTFPDAVRRLAERAGIRLEVEVVDPERAALYRANEFAVQFFISQLVGPARQSQEGRGLPREVIDRFRLGYAPGGNRLFGAARQQGIDPKILERAGLVELREGGYHDRFWDRISFPIFSSSGRVIGFGGRVLDDSRTPKYLNSPETELFKKGENLYGLYQTQDGIRRNGGLMVEGYFDLLSMYTHGFENVVAPLGTALTLAQARLLRRFSPQVTIVFDADRAGIAAAHRALEVLLEANLDPKVALLEAGTDPDSFLKAAGRDELSRRIAEAQDFVDFCYHYRRPLGVGEESDLIQELLGYTSRVSDEVKRELYLKRIAERSGVSFEVLARRLQRPGSTRPLKPRRLLTFEEKIVASVVAEPGLLEAARAELSLDEIEDEGLRKILEVNYESGAISVADLLNHLPSELGERLTGLLARLVDRIRSPDELLTKIQEFKSRKQGKEHLKRLGMEKDEDRRITFLAQILKRAKIRLGSSRTRRE